MIEEQKVKTADANEVKVGETIFFFFLGGGAHSQAHSIIIESHIFPQLNDFYITCLRKHSVVSASGFFTVIFDL